MDVYFTQNSAILICSEGELLIHHSQKDSTRDFDGFSNFPNLGYKVDIRKMLRKLLKTYA